GVLRLRPGCGQHHPGAHRTLRLGHGVGRQAAESSVGQRRGRREGARRFRRDHARSRRSRAAQPQGRIETRPRRPRGEIEGLRRDRPDDVGQRDRRHGPGGCRRRSRFDDGLPGRDGGDARPARLRRGPRGDRQSRLARASGPARPREKQAARPPIRRARDRADRGTGEVIGRLETIPWRSRRESPGGVCMARFRVLAVLAAASAATLSSPAAAQAPPSPYDVTTYSVVWTVPAAKNVRVVRGTRYTEDGASALTLDVTYPSGGDAAKRWPAVVFVNGVGGKLNEWEIYKSWARLAAAHGIAGITAESDPANPAASVRALFAYLAKEGAALRIDSSRLAVWACSGNVRAALPLLMDGSAAGIRAAAILY